MTVLYILTAEAHAVNMCWPSGLARAPTDVIVPPPEMAMFSDCVKKLHSISEGLFGSL